MPLLRQSTAVTIPTARPTSDKPRTVTITSLDFTKHKWVDDPSGKTLTYKSTWLPPFVVMGATAKTPYNPAWAEADAQAATLAQLGITQDMIKPPPPPLPPQVAANPKPPS